MMMRVFLFLTLICTFNLGAVAPERCETALAGVSPPVPLTVLTENARVYDVDAQTLDGDSLRRLGEALRPHRYLGRRPVTRLRLHLFDVFITESVDIVTRVTNVRLGARLERDEREVKIRVELPFARLDKQAAVPRAITDLFNHFDLLAHPPTLTREMTLLRAELARLRAPDLKPLIPVPVLTSAIKLLDDALSLRTPLTGRSAHLGKRYAAYFRARQMLIYAWRDVHQDLRSKRAHQVREAYQPRAPHGPSVTELSDDLVVSQAVFASERLDRPWLFTSDRHDFLATMLWFELVANRGAEVADGGWFLPQKFTGDWTKEELARLDEAPGTVAVLDDDNKTASSLRNTADESASTVADPAQPSTGLPDPGGSDIGIGGVEPTDSTPGF